MIRSKISIFLLLVISTACYGQKDDGKRRIVGGPCEGCEAAFEFGNANLGAALTIQGYDEGSPKITISGTVYHIDSKTPAKGIILYFYHTDRNGIYPTIGDEKGWASRHGYLRGWAKTDASGKYTLNTIRPAAYPNGRAPEHIHVTVLEPGKTPYYIDDIFFDDDPLLDHNHRQKLANRAGSGIVTLKKDGNKYVATRNIVLGLNIPGY